MKMILLKNYIKSTAYASSILLALTFSVSAQRIDNTVIESDSWSTPLNISNSTSSSNSPAIAINKDNQIYVIWTEYNISPIDLYARLFITKYDGIQWSTPEAITEPGNADWTPDIAVDTSGNPHIVWGEWFSGDVFYEYYDGSSWSNPINVSETQGGAFYPCIAITNDNTVHIAWHENGVFYRQLKENQWSDKIRLSDTTMSAGSVKLCTDSNNSVHFTWASLGPNEEEWRIWYRKLENGILNESKLVYYDSTHHPSSEPDIAVYNNNLPAIVWEQITQWDTIPITKKIFYSEFDGVEWIQAETISDSSRSSNPSISIDKNNISYVVWNYTKEIPGEDHTYLLFSYKLNNNWIVPESPDNQLLFNSLLPRISVDESREIHVVWQYGEPAPQFKGEIYYAHRDNISSINSSHQDLADYLILYPNYPNPFNQSTVIKYFLPEGSNVYLTIYNALGQKVKIVHNGYKVYGEHEAIFNGEGLASGIYFCVLKTERKTKVMKMIMTK